MKGLFERYELPVAQVPISKYANCKKCGLNKTCQSPVMPIAGRGLKKIMIIGEAPGATEDVNNKPFCGDAGKRLQQELARNGIDMFEDCWVGNSLRCRPPGNKIPNPRMVDYCRPLTIHSIEKLKPKVIILLGLTAVRSVISHLYKEEGRPEKIGRWTGFQIPVHNWNAWICPAVHPSYLLRQRNDPIEDAEFARHIRNAVRIKERPFDESGPPDYKKQTQIIMDTDEAAVLLDDMTSNALPMISFDFETSTLKPDGKYARIVCCSVCDGKQSIAFPMAGKAMNTLKDILRNPQIAKIGYNAKFESRWVKKHLGIRVAGWGWDGMLVAHTLDSRSGITGLKFNAFTRLGVQDYAKNISKFFKGKGGNKPNRIKEIPINDLYRYCALDSLFEWIIAHQQMKELKCI